MFALRLNTHLRRLLRALVPFYAGSCSFVYPVAHLFLGVFVHGFPGESAVLLEDPQQAAPVELRGLLAARLGVLRQVQGGAVVKGRYKLD